MFAIALFAEGRADAIGRVALWDSGLAQSLEAIVTEDRGDFGCNLPREPRRQLCKFSLRGCGPVMVANGSVGDHIDGNMLCVHDPIRDACHPPSTYVTMSAALRLPRPYRVGGSRQGFPFGQDCTPTGV